MSTDRSSRGVVPAYEQRLERDRRWSMDEGDRHFRARRLGLQDVARRSPTDSRIWGSPMLWPAGWRSASARLPPLDRRRRYPRHSRGPQDHPRASRRPGLCPPVHRQQEPPRHRARRPDRIPDRRRISGRRQAQAGRLPRARAGRRRDRRHPLLVAADARRAEAGLGNDRRHAPPEGLRRRHRADRRSLGFPPSSPTNSTPTSATSTSSSGRASSDSPVGPVEA